MATFVQRYLNLGLEEKQMQNDIEADHTSRQTSFKNQEQALEQANNLNYSSAMNILLLSAPLSVLLKEIYCRNYNIYTLQQNLKPYHSQRKSIHIFQHTPIKL